MSETIYSKKIKGEDQNWFWPVRFDIVGGFLGIQQWGAKGELKDRVLLSPAQVAALRAFIKPGKD